MVNIKLCFLMDCTASMEPWIQAAKNQMKCIVDTIHSDNQDSNIQVAFVGYRDINDTERFVVFSFRSASSLLQSIQGVHAFGGLDEAEDVAGGLVQARRLEWDDADIRMIVHIADAPAHGEKFHAVYVSDEFPEGDPNGLDPLDSMLELSRQDFYYTFIKITSSTDTMLEQFHNAFSLLGTFKVLDLRPQVVGITPDGGRPSDLLTTYLVRSLSDSIARYSSASQDPEGGSYSPI